jgi:hypothetical protein
VLAQDVDRNGKNRQWRSAVRDNRLLRADLLPWPAVLCLDQKRRVVGTYVQPGSRTQGADAVALTTEATLVRLSDAMKFTTEVSADPPRTSSSAFAGGLGDTTPALLAWLKRIAATHK